MKRFMFLVMVLLGLGIPAALAAETTTPQGQDALPQTQVAQPIEVGNKVCPVSGEKVPAPGEKGEMGGAAKYEYNGKIYNLCCSMCIKDFKKNPEKYSKIAEDKASAEAAAKEGSQPSGHESHH